MDFIYLLTAIFIIIPIAIFLSFLKHKNSNGKRIEKKSESYIEGVLILFPLSVLFYGDNFWVNFLYIYALMGYGLGLSLLAIKFDLIPNIDEKWFETYCIGSPLLVIIIFVILYLLGVYDVTVVPETVNIIADTPPRFDDSSDLIIETIRPSKAEPVTAQWVYYCYGITAFMGIVSLFINHIDGKGYLFSFMLLACNFLPFFSESYWWFMLFGAIGFITTIVLNAKTFTRTDSAALGMIIPYFYMMALTGSIMLYGAIWLYKSLFIGIQ